MNNLSVVKNEPRQDVIQRLEEMLALAKAGEISEVNYIYYSGDCYIKGRVGVGGGDVHANFGMLMDLALQYRDEKIEPVI